MTSGRIVVRPVNHGLAPRIVNHLAADFDAITRLHRTSRGDADVVYDLEATGRTLHVEGLVHCVRARSEKETGWRRNRRGEIYPGRARAGVCSGEVHRRSHHAVTARRQEERTVWVRSAT
jgi:hypothetical protein